MVGRGRGRMRDGWRAETDDDDVLCADALDPTLTCDLLRVRKNVSQRQRRSWRAVLGRPSTRTADADVSSDLA